MSRDAVKKWPLRSRCNKIEVQEPAVQALARTKHSRTASGSLRKRDWGSLQALLILLLISLAAPEQSLVDAAVIAMTPLLGSNAESASIVLLMSQPDTWSAWQRFDGSQPTLVASALLFSRARRSSRVYWYRFWIRMMSKVLGRQL
jgi:hypothetical protein